MKNLLLVFIGLSFVFSCKKEKNLDSLYQSFIGKWECTDSNTYSYYEITKSGYFSYSYGLQRNVHFKIFKVYPQEPSTINEVNWEGVLFTDKRSTVGGIFYFNETRDTITITNNPSYKTGDLNNTVSPINYYFVRQ